MFPIETRWKKHIHNALVSKRSSRLYSAIRKHGQNNFDIQILEYIEKQADLNNREIFWIRKLKSQLKSVGYNMTAGGDGGKIPPESIKRMADKRRGIPLTPEHKAKLSKALKGNGKGRKLTKEQKDHISKVLKEKGIKPILNPTKGKFGSQHHFYGKHHSKKNRKIMSMKAKGRKKTQKQKDIAKFLFLTKNPNKKEIPERKIIQAFRKQENYKEVAKSLGLSYQGLIYKIKSIWKVQSISEFICLFVKNISKDMIIKALENKQLKTPKEKAESIGLSVQSFMAFLKQLQINISST